MGLILTFDNYITMQLRNWRTKINLTKQQRCYFRKRDIAHYYGENVKLTECFLKLASSYNPESNQILVNAQRRLILGKYNLLGPVTILRQTAPIERNDQNKVVHYVISNYVISYDSSPLRIHKRYCINEKHMLYRQTTTADIYRIIIWRINKMGITTTFEIHLFIR